MKKILYVEGCRDGTVGGSHKCLYSIISNINRKKYEPIVVFYDDHYIANKLRALDIKIHILSNEKPINFGYYFKKASFPLNTVNNVLIKFQKPINFSWYFLRPALTYAWFIKKNKIDIVHLNNSLNTNHEWILAAKLSCVKIITSQRGYSTLSFSAKYFGKKLDAIISISNKISNELSIQGLDKENLIVVYDGIDCSKIKSSMNAKLVRKLYGIDTANPVIGVVGNIKQWKGQETVVRATVILKKKLPGIKCLLVGGINVVDPYYLELKRIIDEFDIADNVIFTGFQENPADYFNIMDVVIHSSIEPEPFGMVNLEAMYMRKPVISTNIGGPTEIFTSGKDGILINPGDPELLAQTLSFLLDNEEVRRSIGENAYETVIRNFSITNTVRQVEKCYEKICQ